MIILFACICAHHSVHVQVKDYCVESVFCFYLSVGCQVWWEAPLLTELAPQCIFITPIIPWPLLTFNRGATTLLKFFSALYSHIDFHSISFSLLHPILGPVDLLFRLGMLFPPILLLESFLSIIWTSTPVPSLWLKLKYFPQSATLLSKIDHSEGPLVHVFCCLALHQQCKFLSWTLWISSSL